MPRQIALPADPAPEELAKLAKLRYVTEANAGFTRRRSGSGFSYLNTRGAVLRDPRHLNRIKTLAIPPAWEEVWISPWANGHIQATGRDARHRKQYIYHERWGYASNLAKFVRLAPFGAVLPQLRTALKRSLARRSLDRDRVLSGVLALLDLTAIRVGNEEYVKQNNSYGLTTLRDRHVAVTPSGVELRFKAKSGVARTVLVEDKQLARFIVASADVRGPRLFQYMHEDGKSRPVTSGDVNEFLEELTGQPFTAKDFRTWKGSVQTAGRLYDARDVETKTERKRIIRDIVCDAAEMLGNTPTICRNYYVHPELLASYEQGDFHTYFDSYRPRRQKQLLADEPLFIRFLRQWKPVMNGAP